jgi:hypothetical protein
MTSTKQMTDYERLAAEWTNVRDKFALGADCLAEFLRMKGIDSKKKTGDAIGLGGHKDYLRHITKHTECLKHGTTPERHLAHAERQLALYTDKLAKQKETGAGFIRTEVTRDVVGGTVAKAGEAKERRVCSAVAGLLEALEKISECEEDWQGIARRAVDDYKKLLEVRKERKAKKAEEVTPVQEVDEKLDEESEASSEEASSEEEEKPADAPELPGLASDAVLAPPPEPVKRPAMIASCKHTGCRGVSMSPGSKGWARKDGAWFCPQHK